MAKYVEEDKVAKAPQATDTIGFCNHRHTVKSFLANIHLYTWVETMWRNVSCQRKQHGFRNQTQTNNPKIERLAR